MQSMVYHNDSDSFKPRSVSLQGILEGYGGIACA